MLSIIICVFVFIWHKYSPEIHGNPDKRDPLYTPIENNISIDTKNNHKLNKWVSFGGYAGLPYYYTKKGSLQNKEETKKTVSVTTFCDIHLLYEAEIIAKSYISGPISISLFIDDDYRSHSKKSHKYSDKYLKEIFDHYFLNITNKYDITIGVLYYNKSNEFYKSKGFKSSTPLVFRLPMNPLRNLAEYQVVTDWTFNIDVDFWYLSKTLNQNVDIFIKQMNDITSVYGENTVFIVPAFEILTNNTDKYKDLERTELIDMILNPSNPQQLDIMPFHFVPTMNEYNGNMELKSANPQQCTGFNDWYSTESNYKINYMKSNCSLFFEPWYIINTNLSRQYKYKWDNRFIGRGYSKTQRVNTLRHNCFNFIVMKDLFVIHAAQTVHVKLNETLRNHWTGKNRELLVKQQRLQYKDKHSCLTPTASVKIVRFLRAIFLGFGDIAWNHLSSLFSNCQNDCNC